MKKFKILKTVSLLLVTVLVTVALTGCGSNSTAASSKQNSTSANGNTNNKPMNSTSMKTLYTNVLKELVTAKTITQEQSDKVLAAVTKNIPTGNQKSSDNNSAGGQKPSDNGSNGDQNGTASTNGTKPSGNPPSGGEKPNGQAPNGSKGNPQSQALSQLITDKVITQAQADTISQKVQAAMNTSQNTSTN